MGLCSVSARLGAASGVYILETIGSGKPAALSITEGILVIIITASLVLILPERSQKPLLVTIQSEDDEIKAEREAAAEATRTEMQEAANQIHSVDNSAPAPHETTPRLSFVVPDSAPLDSDVPVATTGPKGSKKNEDILESSDDEETEVPRSDDDSGQETRDRDSMFSTHEEDSSSVQSANSPTTQKR